MNKLAKFLFFFLIVSAASVSADWFISGATIAELVDRVRNGGCTTDCRLTDGSEAFLIAGPIAERRAYEIRVCSDTNLGCWCGSAGCGVTAILIGNNHVWLIDNAFNLDARSRAAELLANPDLLDELSVIDGMGLHTTNIDGEIVNEPGISIAGQDIAEVVPFLEFPLRCWRSEAQKCDSAEYSDGAYSIASPDPDHPGIINSILDHSMEHVYSADGYVVAFTGEQRGNGWPEKSGSYPDSKTSQISVSGLYRGDSTSGYRSGLNYDGHPGYDFYALSGAPVYAAASGTVVDFGGQRCIPKGLNAGCRAWGFLGINHDNGFVTQYGHLSIILKLAGQKVEQGELIGRVGNTAPYPMSAHLHFEVLARSHNCGLNHCVVDPYGWDPGQGDDPLSASTGMNNVRLWKRVNQAGS